MRPRSMTWSDLTQPERATDMTIQTTRRKLTTMLTAVAVVTVPAVVLLRPRRQPAAAAIQATLYKNPQCNCCEAYARYLDQNGFQVVVTPTHGLAEISRKAGVPEDLEGCHTMFVGDYVVDGHVPVEIIRK